MRWGHLILVVLVLAVLLYGMLFFNLMQFWFYDTFNNGLY